MSAAGSNRLWMCSAVELAGLIAAREVSAVEVMDAHLARIADVNPRINAIVKVLAAEALQAAKAADDALAAGSTVGPLHGVPFTVKENIDVKGTPTTWGVPALSDAVVPLDAPVVERIRSAGAIPIGRTNLPDFAMRLHTDSSAYGPTINPWNPARTVGGSSGGETAALAVGMSPLGLGNDIGGSLRIPAATCGVASIRPSLGRVPDAGLVPHADRHLAVQLMNVQGPMARTVADVRLALRIMMGAHPRDPWAVSSPFVGEPIQGRVRVALVRTPPGDAVDAVIGEIVDRVAVALQRVGYEVVESCPPRFEEAVEVWGRFLMGDLAAVFAKMKPMMNSAAVKFLDTFNTSVRPVTDADALSELMVQRESIARAWSEFQQDFHLILSPTWTRMPFEAGLDVATEENIFAAASAARAVLPANLLGLPSANVAGGFDPLTGLPVGVLLTGQRFREDLCLEAAEHIEAFFGRHLPIDPRNQRNPPA
jgi:amidase